MNKKRRLLVKIIFAMLCLAAVTIIATWDIRSRGMEETDFMYARFGKNRISVFETDGQYYLFLPSFLTEEDIILSSEAKKHDIRILKSENISSVFITTRSRNLDSVLADKDYKESGKIVVYDSQGHKDTSTGLEFLKGRGNYSWNNWDKKPFKIKLQKNTSVLGLGNGKDYAFIANASDATLIRNAICRDIEKDVEIPFAGEGRFIDLYINGDYMGNYYLCPSIEVGKDRVNITNIDIEQDKVISKINDDALSPYETPTLKGWNIPDGVTDITGGYLVEREFMDRYRLEYGELKNGFITNGNEHFIVVSPQYCSKNEINYISSFFEEAEAEILTGEGLGTRIDIDSFAKRYLVEEVVKNYDGGVSSAYYYKDSDLVDGKLYAGPGWDFDMSLGNYLDWMEYDEEDATGITRLYLAEHSSIYYKELAQNQEFSSRVRSYYWGKVQPYMEYLLDEGIDAYEKELSASAAMDSIRWNQMYQEHGYSTADHKEYENLKSFIRERTDFLNEEWAR
ncbi:hypothetical protein D6855_03950 [Butyrivibrio sp. CB08]|uniref:CotH kinase family protein n=1 Tax=Butyrivibrio sp. CB08 TaxID=2364879 RepID=UPI000EA8623D|nr:CotH kinase family protein [Butyrivibrio sp. CB08]RKM61060.1 hypothetical protein D6855_03950 [Butyrivibrio sp. CB08]